MPIKEIKKGKFVVNMRDQYGSRIYKTFDDIKEAKAYEALINHEKHQRKLGALNMTTPQYSFYTELKHFENTKSDLRPKSIKRYAYIIEQIRLFAEFYKVRYVSDFTNELATIFREELTKERVDPKGSTNRIVKAKPKTINFYLAVLKAFFKEQFEKGNIQRNPTLHVKNAKIEEKKVDYYKADELEKFFKQNMDIAYRNAFTGLLLTGLRFGELANLKWSNVNLEKKIMMVESDESFTTKTINSERVIPINQKLLDILLSIAHENENEFVFKSPKGMQLRERHLLEKCKVFAKRAGINSTATLHKFRHTFATLLIQNGVAIQNIKELLGHSSIVQTEIYAHNKTDHLHSEMKILDSFLK